MPGVGVSEAGAARWGPRLTAASLLASALVLVSWTRADAEVIALTVGIDDYAYVTDLDGAVADAEDLARALAWLGARTTLMLDRGAAREPLLRQVDDAIATSGPDDVIVFSFAGHGIQVPDRNGDEADGYDEAFVLSGYRPGEQDWDHLIVDDEIERLVRRAAPRTVIFLADSCHSGTMLRGPDPRADFRKVRALPRASFGAGRALAPGAGRVVSPVEAPDNLVFLGAVPEHLGVQEVLIDGQARGALSYAFARAVEGRADRDGDLSLTSDELVSQVAELVRVLSQGRQTPSASTGTGSRGVLFRLPANPPPVAASEPPSAPTPVPLAGTGTWGGGLLRLALQGGERGGERAVVERLRGVEVVSSSEAADLILDQPSGDILTSSGDVAARLGAAREVAVLQGIVDKWRLLRGIEDAVDGRLEARVLPDDVVLSDGTPFVVRIRANDAGRLVLFDLASDGSVIVLYPRGDDEPLALSPGQVLDVRLRAGPPFGADHLVAALVPPERVAPLADLLRAAHGRPLSLERVERLAGMLAPAGPLPIAVYTAP